MQPRSRPNRRVRGSALRPLPARSIKAGGRRLREILGIILVALTALIILSLASYDPRDLCFSVGSTSATKAFNWVGTVGAYLADGLIFLLGLTAWLTPLLTFYLALILFIPATDAKRKRVARISGIFLLIFVLAGFAGVFGLKYPSHEPPQVAQAGGFLGQAVGRLLTGNLGQAGGLVVLTALFFIGVILATGISLAQIGGFLLLVWKWLRGTLGGWLFDIMAARSQTKAREKPKLGAPRSLFPRPVQRRPEIVEGPHEIKIAQPVLATKQTQFKFHSEDSFQLPPLTLLTNPPPGAKKISHDTLLMNSKILEKKLKDFGIDGQVTHVHPGPVITMYEYAPAPGVKVNRIANLQDDLAMAMSAYSVRVVAPIPGKSVVGIEIPNAESETVFFIDVLSTEEFKKSKSKLTFALGKDIFGNPVTSDLARMPHLLIAGATGSGKSVMLNTLICSILFRATPSQVKFLFIDPKMVELMPYEGIPHLITPVVTNPKKASWALKNIVSIMEGRYKILSEKDAKNIESYNHLVKEAGKKGDEDETMPYLVIVIDELADLMMLASNDVEDSVTRLAQMARAVGIHLVLATQRPSVNVITGVIKANLPTRISFQVSSKNDSRIILDANGAESLLGKGDMLFLPPGASKLRRIHGAYISEGEIRRVVDFVKEQGAPTYDENILKPVEESDDEVPPEGQKDEKYEEAIELVRRTGQASISMIQRRLRVGYNRAARMVELMEKEGIITPPDGVRPRRILS